MNHFLRLKRRYYRQHTNNEWLQTWLSEPLPSSKVNAKQVDYLVVDLEMTGLEAQRDKIVSMGWVAINNGVIAVDTAQHLYIKLAGSVGQSATIHQIRDVDLSHGLSEPEALKILLSACKNRVVVFHGAWLDYSFLSVASKAIYKIPFLLPVVDTLQLEKQNYLKAGHPISAKDLRLAACRERYNLPFYPAHNALVDALATAELLLALLANKNKVPLSSVLA